VVTSFHAFFPVAWPGFTGDVQSILTVLRTLKKGMRKGSWFVIASKSVRNGWWSQAIKCMPVIWICIAIRFLTKASSFFGFIPKYLKYSSALGFAPRAPAAFMVDGSTTAAIVS
jgi:hypothetical protein